jgi:Kef-type K+ transport system membrane component KefB
MQYFFNHLFHEFQLPLTNPVLVFSLVLLIILLSPLVLKRFNIPGIIGLIISGVIIGPFGLNFLEKNSAIDLFSTIGLLYIMFIAGLELDINDFKINKYKSLLFGFLTFFIPLAIGYPVLRYGLGYDVNASFLTASMFSTHTLVAYPIVSRLGIAKNQAVAIAVGGTILTDTAVLLILAVIIGNSQGDLDSGFWLRLLVSIAIFSAIMFYLIPIIAKWFFQKLESEKHSHYIFVLSVVFFAAFLAEVAGLEKIIGAFVAGLALNKLIPHTSALMNRIEYIGNSLFIPFFFITVGMMVDVMVFGSSTYTVIVALLLTVVALFGKWLAAFLTQILLKYNKHQRNLIFGLSGSRAAAALAIVLVGYQHQIIDETILNGTIVLILLTCIVASYVAERAAKQILLETDDDSQALSVPLKPKSEEKILVSIGANTNLEKLLEFAQLIQDKKSNNPISFLSVVPNDEVAERNMAKSKRKLEEIVKQGAASEIKVNPITTIDHNVANGIGRVTKEIGADYVIVGWMEKTGFFDKLFGERAQAIINNVDKTLFVCKLEKPFVGFKRMVIVSPDLAEREFTFKEWVQKLTKMAKELSIPVIHIGDEKTHEAIKKVISDAKIAVNITYKTIPDFDDFVKLTDQIFYDDLMVLISSRRGSISYLSDLDSLADTLEKYFEDNSKIIVYPQQFEYHFVGEHYDDFTLNPLSKGIEQIGNIFKGN